jgi:hypothetical protein
MWEVGQGPNLAIRTEQMNCNPDIAIISETERMSLLAQFFGGVHKTVAIQNVAERLKRRAMAATGLDRTFQWHRSGIECGSQFPGSKSFN